jgi:hypothetical protein
VGEAGSAKIGEAGSAKNGEARSTKNGEADCVKNGDPRRQSEIVFFCRHETRLRCILSVSVAKWYLGFGPVCWLALLLQLLAGPVS